MKLRLAILVLIILLVILCEWASAKNYYVSSTWSGTESGTLAAPYKSIAKVNSSFALFLPGDSILFKCGETFYGQLTTAISGTSAKPLIFSSYGTGAKPILTAFQTLSGWVSVGTNLYESAANSALGATVNCVNIDGVPYAMGKFPNEDNGNGGWNNLELYDSVDATSKWIIDKQLTTSTNWTNAELVVRTNNYIIDRTKITSHTTESAGGSRLTYGTALTYNPMKNYGYFIQNDVRTLDRQGEWYYNPTKKTLTVYLTSPPSGYVVQASAQTYGIYNYNFDYIHFENLQIQGGNSYGIYSYSGDGIVIKKCDISFSGILGVQLSNGLNAVLDSCVINYSYSSGLLISNAGGVVARGKIKNNTIKNVALFKGMAQNGALESMAIKANEESDSIMYNTIDSIGFLAIRLGPNNTVAVNNYISHFCQIKDDGSGIYIRSDDASSVNVGRTMVGNIIIYTPSTSRLGTSNPTGRPSVNGIYLDDYTHNVLVTDNFSYGSPNASILVHNAFNNTIRNNTFVDGENVVYYSHNLTVATVSPLTNNIFRKNIVWASQPYYLPFKLVTVKNDAAASLGLLDSNYYARPFDNHFYNTSQYTNVTPYVQEFDLAGIRTFYSKEVNSVYSDTIMPYKFNSFIGSNKFTPGDFTLSTDINTISVGTKNATIAKAWDNTNKFGNAGSFKMTVSNGTAYAAATIAIPVGSLSTTKKYIVRFSIVGSEDTVIGIYPRSSTSKVMNNNGIKTQYRINTTPRTVEFAFTPTINDAAAIIYFETWERSGSIWIDNFKCYEADVNIYTPSDSIRIEYNPSKTPKVVALSGTYKDAKGVSYINTITIPAYGSACLMKKSAGNPSNVAPTNVVMTSPANASTFTAPASIVLTSTASDADGSIANVSFYQNNNLLNSDLTSPYTYTWSNVPAGSYTLKSIATDDDGASTTSSPLTITVQNATNAPSVSMTSPTNGWNYTAPATITVAATATDVDGTIANVKFYKNSTLINTDVDSPYTFNVTSEPIGIDTFYAVATDNSALTSTSSYVIVSVGAANTAPTVSLTSPANHALYDAPVNIPLVASVTDDGIIDSVRFYKGSTVLTTLYNTPYNYTLNNAPTGIDTFSARAYDNGGLSTLSALVIDTVNILPTISLTSTASTYPAGSNIVFTATSTDADGSVKNVAFYNGSTLMSTDATSPYSWTWNAVPSGSYTIKAVATDNRNATASSTKAITVSASNTPPTVSVTSPASNAIILHPASVTINATASDAGGSVTKVDFYNNTTLLGSDNSAPYSFIWAAPVGAATIKAKATDNGGLTTTTAGTPITVKGPVATITAPANNTTYAAHPATITMNVTATDAYGTISKVEYYAGSVLTHTEVTAPYSWPISIAAAGTYVLTAKAYDSLGATTTSAGITVIVK